MKFLLSAALALCLAPAFAQESVRNFYVGVHGGQAHWRLCPAGQTCEDISGTLRVLAGYQINSIFSGEVAFNNLGRVKGQTASIKGNAWEAVGIAAWPVVGSLSVYGKLGAFRSELKGDGTLTGAKEGNWGPTYGLGLKLEVSRNFALRGEWQAYPSVGGSTLPKGDIDALTVGALWRFR